VSARDSGIGMPRDKLDSIFECLRKCTMTKERHRRFRNRIDMVNRLVELHGGSIEATSAGIGQGSEFVVRLPLCKVSTITW
jgi:K+-sensing histidine kinase KdpD